MNPPDRRSPIAIGFERASRISMVGVTFVLPIMAGHGLDRWLGINPVGLLMGVALGSIAGFLQLLQVARPPATQKDQPEDHPSDPHLR